MVRLLLCLLIPLLCGGCFVFDEINKGQELMEQHSPKDIDEEPPPAAASSSRRPKEEPNLLVGLLDSAKAWWKAETAPKPVERDPDDIVVRCDLGDRMQFTRKSDCQVRGGTIL